MKLRKEKETLLIETGYQVVNVPDGDGVILFNKFRKTEEEFRLYGIDAPEVKKCKKIIDDEIKLRLPAQLLIELGFISMKYLKELLPIGSSCFIVQEKGREFDFYNRRLAYVHLSQENCVNDVMIQQGYAKPFNEYYCTKLKQYQALNLSAKRSKKGLYKIVNNF